MTPPVLRPVVFGLLLGALFAQSLATTPFPHWLSPQALACDPPPKASSAHQTEPQPAGITEAGIQEFRLPSGQTLYVKEDHDSPIVTIDSWVTTGSVNETDDTNGVSHFLEHLIFKGTRQYKAGEIDRLIESKGATFNAATSDDFTHYYITIASPFFEEALAMHANMLLDATIPPEELVMERKVVQEEINRATDNPDRKMFIALNKLLFGTHGYAMDTLGPKELIGSIPREKILSYYHHWYRPQNIKTVIVGDVDTQRVRQLVSTHFSAEKYPVPQDLNGAHYTPPMVQQASPPETFKTQVIEDENVSQAHLTLAFMGPSIENRADALAMDVAMQTLGSGASSRLYSTLKEKQQLVTDISAGNWTQRYAGLLYTSAELKPENLAAARQALFQQIETLKTEGITEEELQKAKTQTIKEFVFLNEKTSGVATSVGYNVAIGKLSDYTEYVQNIQKVTRESVQQAAQRYLDFGKAVVVQLLPPNTLHSATETLQLDQELARLATSEKPVSPSSSSISVSASEKAPILRETLSNGATLLMKPRKNSDTVAIKLFAKGGKATEGLPGLSDLLASVMMKGTETRSAEALAKELESRGMGLSIESHADYLDISAKAVSSDLGELFLILQDVLTHPALLPEEIEKEKAVLLETLKTSRDNPAQMAMENLSLAMYPHHPYGNVGKRVEAHLEAIDREALLAYFNAQVVPQNMVISVVGDFDPDTVKRYIESALPTRLNPGQAVINPSKPVPTLPAKEVVEDGKPKQAATWIAQGWLMPESTSPDYAPLKVVNSLLGSGLSSRLFVNLREKEGLAYAVSSMYPTVKDKGQFILYIGTDPKNRERVIEGFEQEIHRLKTVAVPAKELQEAKDKLSGGFALAHETNANQAFYLAFYEVMGLGYQFDEAFSHKVQQVTAKDIQRVVNTYFSKPSVLSIAAPQPIKADEAGKEARPE